MELPTEITPLAIGKANVLCSGKEICILALGPRVHEALLAAEKFRQKYGHEITIVDARFVKPLDEKLIESVSLSHNILITIEEGAAGGFGAHVAHFLAEHNLLEKIKFKMMHLPDKHMEHNKPYDMYEAAGLNASGILATIESLMHRQRAHKKAA